MPDIETIIAEIKAKAEGRTRYEGQPPYWDELLVAEILRLRSHCETLHNEIYRLTHPAESERCEEVTP